MKAMLAVLLAATCATCAFGAADKAVQATTKDAFAAVAANVRHEMDGGGRYAYVKPAERDKVEHGLGEMQALFDKAGSVDAMSRDDKIALFNAQESVNAVLELRDRDRLVCERGAVPGSRIVSTTCRTYGEIEAQREASQKLMQEKIAGPCISQPCKGG